MTPDKLAAQDQLAALEDLWISRDKYSPGARGLGERYGDIGLSLGTAVNELSRAAMAPAVEAYKLGSEFASEFGGGLSGAPKPKPTPTSKPVLPRSLSATEPPPEAKGKSTPEPTKEPAAFKESKPSLGSGNLRAYKTPDGKVYFSNAVPTEGATEVSYADEAGKARQQIRGELGLSDSGPGTVSTPQGTDEMIRDRAARDAMMKNMAAEASLSDEDKFQRNLRRQREMAGAQTDNKMSELKRLTDFYMGQTPGEGSPIFEEMKAKTVEAWKKDPRRQGIPDQKLWEDAHLQVRLILQNEAAEKALKLLMVQNRMTSEPMMMSSMDAPNAQ